LHSPPSARAFLTYPERLRVLLRSQLYRDVEGRKILILETTRRPTPRGSSESTKGEAPGGASRDGSERCSIGISGTEMLEEVSWRRAESVGARDGDATSLDLGLYFHDRFSLIKIRVEAQSPTSTPPAFRVVLIRIGFTSFAL
jgi:hypothetical protein